MHENDKDARKRTERLQDRGFGYGLRIWLRPFKCIVIIHEHLHIQFHFGQDER